MLRVHVNADIMVFPPRLLEKLECQSRRNIWHKYHDWYFKIVIRNLIWDDFEISRVVLMPNITYKSCYYLFIPLPAKGFVIFTCSYFKLSWNTTALSQWNLSNFSCSSIRKITLPRSWGKWGRFGLQQPCTTGKNQGLCRMKWGWLDIETTCPEDRGLRSLFVVDHFY